MHKIVIRLRGEDLAAKMAAMRKWLDEHRCEPSKFTCAQEGSSTVISADFNDDTEARAFKNRFDSERPEPERVNWVSVEMSIFESRPKLTRASAAGG